MAKSHAVWAIIGIALLQAISFLYVFYQMKHVRVKEEVKRPPKWREIDLHTRRSRFLTYTVVTALFFIGPLTIGYGTWKELASVWDLLTYTSIVLLFLAGLFPIMHVRWFRPSIESRGEDATKATEITKSELGANLAAEVALFLGVVAATSGMLGPIIETKEAKFGKADLSQGCLSSIVDFVESFDVASRSSGQRDDIVKRLPISCRQPVIP